MTVTAQSNEPIERDPSTKKRNRLLILFTLFLLVIGTLLALIYFFYWQYYESTDDAYGSGSLVQINSVIDGSVVAFYADDTDLVKEGQLLVQLDPTFYQAAYDRALAALSAEVLNIKQLRASVLVNEADVAVKKIALSKAEYDFNNRSALVGSRAISNEDYTHSQDALNTAKNDLKRSEAQLKYSTDALGQTPIEEHPRIVERKNAVREAYYNLKHTAIYAPATGFIAQRTVNAGQTVGKGRSLMSVIPKDYVWVDANFKETQLKYMRIGQPAEVWFDLYGSGVKYEGKVLGIASGSGSVFSLIPPQNATGNWIKIVQRLPVRIALDKQTLEKYPIRLGISANVDVNIANQDLPMLAEVPSSKMVTGTRIFDIDMAKVDRVIQEIMEKQEL